MIGSSVSHYQITEKLGGGGMGVVYRARDTHLDRDVALKFLPAHLSTDGEARERFVQEAKAASALDHPNICAIYDVDVTNEGELFIAMALYEGETLKKKLARSALPSEQAVDIASQVAAGLSAAHKRGIVHRDIKPANLFVTEVGRVVVLDFGLAKLVGAADITRPGSTLGTAAYMSPEQTRSESVDERTDIWSLGVVLYEMLSGRRPFEGEYEQAVSYAIVNEPFEPPLDLPEDVQEILCKALAKQASERYDTADAMQADLKKVPAPKPVATREANPAVNRPLRWYAALGVFLILALAYMVWRLVGNDAAGTPGDLPSVAVLPLRTFAAEPGQDYFADAMTEALITNLSKIEGLSVRSRQSVMRYEESDEELPTIAERLRVGYLLEGSVFWGLDSLRIDAQLIEGSTDTHVWSNQYVAEAGQVLRVQRDLALAIAHEIGATLTEADHKRTLSPREVDPNAYRLLLTAQNLRTAGYASVCQNTREAILLLEDAVSIDSTFALAWPHLGSYDAWVAAFCPDVSVAELKRTATEHLNRAIQLDPHLAAPYVARAILMQLEGNWVEAEEALVQAASRAPQDVHVYVESCLLLLRTGRATAALQAAKKAIEIDPVNAGAHQAMTQALYYSRRYDDALRWADMWSESSRQSAVPRLYRALALSMRGRMADAIVTAEEASEADPAEWAIGTLGYLYAKTGALDEAMQLVDRCSESGWEYGAALIYLGLGNTDRTLTLLEGALSEKRGTWGYFPVDPWFDSLRSEPRFQALMRQLGLEPES